MFPQWEHARLAGALALAWGNDAFPRPPVAFEPFVRGVVLHDRGYAPLDADGIGEVGPERWLEIQRDGFAPRGDDLLVDLVVALHVRRLVGEGRDEAEAAAAAAMEAALPPLHAAAGVSEEDAAAADRITSLCDRIAFAFCFEEAGAGGVEVDTGPDGTRTRVAYAVDGRGGITLAPWPLAVPRLTGILLGYRAETYPDELDAVVTPFEVAPG